MESRRDQKAALAEAFALAGKGLANPKRLELLDLLAQGERSVDALARAAGLQVTSASAHLQTLRESGLVARRRDGARTLYRLAGDDVAALLAVLRSVARRHVADVELARRGFLGLDGGDDVPVRDVDRDELLARARSGDVVVLDVRPSEEFESGHIPGAVSIPVAELADRLGELSADVDVVAYCRGAYCVMSYDAVRLLRERGRRAEVLSEGMLEWRAAGHPVGAAR
jgi:rhodanese-related sulfurtransferase/DNA-binding transcriptional ArsR family regulator